MLIVISASIYIFTRLLKASGLLTVAVVLIGSDASKAKEKSNPFVWQGEFSYYTEQLKIR